MVLKTGFNFIGMCHFRIIQSHEINGLAFIGIRRSTSYINPINRIGFLILEKIVELIGEIPFSQRNPKFNLDIMPSFFSIKKIYPARIKNKNKGYECRWIPEPPFQGDKFE